MRFLLLCLVPFAAQAEWAGTWVGKGQATIFGDGPFDCYNISYQVGREDLGETRFNLLRSGTTQQCGPYQVKQGTLKSEVEGDSIWITRRDGIRQKIGSYSDTLISVDFECMDCSAGIGRITEVAELLDPTHYRLTARTYTKGGQNLLRYDYLLTRQSTEFTK